MSSKTKAAAKPAAKKKTKAPAAADRIPVTPPVPEPPAPAVQKWLTVRGARHHNLKNIDVAFPLGRFVCVTGVSGSGKSSLVNDILYAAAAAELNLAEIEPGDYDRIDGLEHLDKVIDIDQSPIGRTPRSNPATYTKVFDLIRDLFASMPEAKLRGYPVGRFSFNVSGGRCEACEGNGAERKDMEFLADVWITCPVCEGRRFSRETLEIKYKGRTISEVLDMDVQTALEHFANIPKLAAMLQTLHDVGLDYIKLGQSSTTLSGGEAQRIKLAKELSKRSTGRTLYILDEPTTGLHFADIARLLKVLHGFVDAGNTVVVIEHNLDVVKTADWIIDLGPEGGAGGGRIVCEGTPEQVAACEASPTGRALRAVLPGKGAGGRVQGAGSQGGSVESGHAAEGNGRAAAPSPLTPDPYLRVTGARQHNLKDVSLAIPRGKITVFSGLSGSGKTSLAMDTIYAEGQRRYVESLSSYARQFLGRLQKPAVDHISGLSPAIAIEQKTVGNTPRSTVGTVTEIYDYLRVLFARIGKPHCTECGGPVGSRTVDQIVDAVLTLPEGSRALLLAPLAEPEDRAWDDRLREARKNGFVRARIDGAVVELADGLSLDRKRRHAVELVADRAVIRPDQRGRLADSIEAALAISGGRLTVAPADAGGFAEMRFNQKHSCQTCGTAFEELTPHHFSFNAPLGWCQACDGLGRQSGANPAVVVPHPERSIREGAIAGWKFAGRKPKADGRKPKAEPAAATIEPTLEEIVGAVCRYVGLSMDEPFGGQPPERRHKLLYGTGEDWIDVRPGLSVQFHGLFPAISRAAKLSWAHRSSLSHVVADVECSTCRGGRVRADAAAVRIAGKTIADVCTMPLAEAYEFFRGLKVPARERKVVGEALNELVNRLKFLIDVGLEYLHLHRSAPTLSGGESQRIQLAGRLGSGLTGVLYVLDEPTIGLHPRDTRRLVKALAGLRDLGNTLIMVEHDRDVIAAADHVVDFGPGAGRLGGRVVAEGAPASLARPQGAGAAEAVAQSSPSPQASASGGEGELGESHTARHLAGRDDIPIPAERRPGDGKFLELIGARHNNLQGVDVRFPLGTLTAVTGVSGSGKSSLIGDILRPALARKLHRANVSPAGHDELRGVQHLDKVIDVDQTPLGSTPTSNPATYTGAFDDIRLLFARLPESRERGYKADRFSFNKPGGRCEACEGAGRRKIEMHFLADVWVECEGCRGTRYQSDVLEVRHRGKNISDVLNMTVDDAAALFAETPKIARTLQTLADVGLGYLQLGQPADTLSGGESQRVRLAAELARPSTGRTLYLLDEPTTGLHVEDVRKLLAVLHKLVDLGNTVVVIEHNLDVIKNADWILDMGPEAGAGGGRLVAAGTPEQVAAVAESHTGRALAPVLARSPREAGKPKAAGRDAADGPDGLAELIELLGRLVALPDRERMEYEHTRICRPGVKASEWFLTVLPSVKPAMWLKLRGAFADAQVAGLSAARKLSGGWWEVNVAIHEPADLAAPTLRQLLARCLEGSPKSAAGAGRGRRVEADE